MITYAMVSVIFVKIKTDDFQIIKEFLQFTSDNKITPVRSMSSGAGHYSGLFDPNDIQSIQNWFKEHHAKDKWTLIYD